ncbi:MAG: peptidase S55 [Synergistaceae bacterium]|nr:peptidase S55 [Synergistaceae bacterium]
MPINRLRPGMRGYTLTVLKGMKPARLPIEVVSVIPRNGSIKNAVLIRMLPSSENTGAGFAQGMSGSPVYLDGKLVGAIGMGWNFSDHKTALVTPIGEMCEVFSRPDKPVTLKGPDGGITGLSRKSPPLMVGGLSKRTVSRLGKTIGIPVESVPWGAAGDLPVEGGRFSPGDAIEVLLAWGDVEMAAAGTVTATSGDGRFLAFGHAFMGRGAVNFPVARARIHDTVSSQLSPFKLASPTALVGTATQDREAGVGGRMGYFTPAIAATLKFRDMDAGGGTQSVKNFRLAPDEALGARLLEAIYGGLVDDQWGRKGQGTAMVTLRVEGRGLPDGWTRTNVFFSDDDVSSVALRESAAIMDVFLRQPFVEVYPLGFMLDVSATQEPKLLMIEDVVVSSNAKPGETLNVEVTLRPWRRAPIKRYFKITVPKDVTGVCELIVRGGGTNPLVQLAIDGGWKTIDGFDRLLTELSAVDANNELIIELLHDSMKNRTPQDGKKFVAELIPEEKEFLSETKTRRIREGTLRISRSEYVVDGLMKRLINVGDEE